VTALLVAQVVATLALTGLVWFVQVVHYPLFARVGTGSFAEYEREHTRRTTWLVMPLMLVEAFVVVALLLLDPSAATVLGGLLLAGIWASTFLVQVPCHRVLEKGWSSPVHTRLVRSNWVRTALWTARSGIAVWLLV
jgi:hypothetical protein